MIGTQRFLTVVAAGLLVLAGVGCTPGSDAPEIDLSHRSPEPPAAQSTAPPPIRVAIGSMITPREGYGYYRRLVDYLGARLGRPVQIVDRHDYDQTNLLLEKGRVEMAFVCGRPYVEGRDRFGLELLVVPVVGGETVYRGLIVVPAESPFETLDDLRGKRFAFTDPLSLTGCLVPRDELLRRGETAERFFGKLTYTYAHDESIKAVARKLVDGAAVDGLVWSFMEHRYPEITGRARVIWHSPPYGIPPVVVPPALPSPVKTRLRDIFLTMDESPEGREILEGLFVDRFVTGVDDAYDAIRRMRARVEGAGKRVGASGAPAH